MKQKSRRLWVFFGVAVTVFMLACSPALTESLTLCFGGLPQCAFDVDTSSGIAPDAAVDEPGERFARVKERLAGRYESLNFSRTLITMSPEHMISDLYAGGETAASDLISIGHCDFAQLERDGIIKTMPMPESLRAVPLPSYVKKDADELYAIVKYIRLPMLFVHDDVPEELKKQVLDIVEPNAWTWKNLFALAETVAAYNSANATEWMLLSQNDPVNMPYFIQALCAREAAADEVKAALIQTLEAYKAAEKAQMVQMHGAGDAVQKAVLELRMVTCVEMGERTVLPMPTLEDVCLPRVSSAQYFMLSAQAPNEQDALAFLQAYTEETMAYSEQNPMDYGLVDAARYPYAVSEKNRDAWAQAMQETTLPDYRYLAAATAMDAYLSGDKTAEAYAEQLFRQETE